MITLKQARKIDPTLEDLTDEELERVLETLYNLADISISRWIGEHQAGSKVREGYLADEEEVR